MSMKIAVILLGLVASAFGGLFGGFNTVPLEKVEKLDDFRQVLVEHFNKFYKPVVFFGIYDITHVERQIVHGVRYKVQFHLVPTECVNSPRNFHRVIGSTHGKCKVNSKVLSEDHQFKVRSCEAVMDQHVNGNRNVTSMSCVEKFPFMKSGIVHRNTRSVSSEEEHAKIGSFEDFAVFKAKHGRVYSSPEEELKKFQIFSTNMKKAHVLNAIELGSAVYGHSPFADMTEEEFRRTHLSPQWDLSRMPEEMAKPVFAVPPTAFDWRDHGAVSEVKNQGSCGSCWAFSTTGNVEGQWAIKKKALVSLSEQELVDCDHIDQGCNGGLPTNAYKVIQKLGGLETEKAYPYEGRDDSCKFKKPLAKVYINGSVSLPTNEDKMAAWLAVNGPISIGINAAAMQFYFGGISHPWSIFCNPSKLDHGVLIVGYGMKGSEPYWIVKNSWGPSWGEQGYYLVYRGSGVCGLNRMPTSATVN